MNQPEDSLSWFGKIPGGDGGRKRRQNCRLQNGAQTRSIFGAFQLSGWRSLTRRRCFAGRNRLSSCWNANSLPPPPSFLPLLFFHFLSRSVFAAFYHRLIATILICLSMMTIKMLSIKSECNSLIHWLKYKWIKKLSLLHTYRDVV